MRRFWLIALFILPLRAGIIDRIAIIVDQQVITEAQINEEVRVTALLNDEAIHENDEARRAAADRLVQQLLVKREMDLGNYPPPTAQEVQSYYDQVTQTLGGAARFSHEIASYKVTSEVLQQHLALQLTTLRFIEYRFRPDFSVSEEEIAAYRKRHAGLSSDAAHEAVIEERTDQILAAWLEESRKQVNIIFLDKALQ